MGANFVQIITAVPGTTTNTVSATFTNPQTAGNLNVIAVGWYGATTVTVTATDTKGNTYSTAAVPTEQASGTSWHTILYAPNILGGANTLTVTFSANVTHPDIRALEYSGVNAVSPLDVTASAVGTAATASSGSAITTQNNDLIFGAGNSFGAFTAPGAGFVSRAITTEGMIAEDAVVSTAGSNSVTAAASNNWVMQMAAFKPASTGAIVSAIRGAAAVSEHIRGAGNAASNLSTAFSDNFNTGSLNSRWAIDTGSAPGNIAGINVGTLSAANVDLSQNVLALKVTQTGTTTVTNSAIQTLPDIGGTQTPGNWFWTHDTGTPGTSTGSSVIVTTPSLSGHSRQFNMSWTASGGERFSVFFDNTALDSASTGYVYDCDFFPVDLTHINELEFDMNQIIPDGDTVIFGVQFDFVGGFIQYTSNNTTTTSKWNNSNIPCTKSFFNANAWNHLRFGYHRDATGNVTYDFVAVNGDYKFFTTNTTVSSHFPLGNTPIGANFINFQMDGDSTSNSTTAYLDNVSIIGYQNPINSVGAEVRSLATFGYGTYQWTMRSSSTATTPAGAGDVTLGQISSGFTFINNSQTEIDSPEIEGQTPNTIEWTNFSGTANSQATETTLVNPDQGFHTYGFKWQPTKIDFLTDGVIVSTHTLDIPTVPASVLFNHWGTNGTGFGGFATVGITRWLYFSNFSFTPLAPVGSAIIAGTLKGAKTHTATVSWNASVGATSYNVKKSSFPTGPFITIGSTASLTFNDTATFLEGNTYYYEVTSVGPGGESGPSSIISAFIPITIPPNGIVINAAATVGATIRAKGFSSTSTTSLPGFIQINSANVAAVQNFIAVTYLSNQTAGNLNVLAVGWYGATTVTATATDTLGNTYVTAVPPMEQVTGSGNWHTILYAKNIIGGANTVTVTLSAAVTHPDVRALEYSGLDKNNPLDAIASAVGTGTTAANSGTAITSQNNDLIFGGGNSFGAFTVAGVGFNLRAITSEGMIAEDELVSAAGPNAATATTNNDWVMQMAAFKTAPPASSAKATVSGTAKALARMVSSAQGASAISGVLHNNNSIGTIVAVINGHSSCSGIPKGIGKIANAVSGASSVSSSIKSVGKISSSVTASCAITSVVKGIAKIKAPLVGGARVQLTFQRGEIIAGCLGKGLVTGILIGKTPNSVAALINGTSSIVASVKGIGKISSSVFGHSSIVPTISAKGKITDSITGTAIVSGVLNSNTIHSFGLGSVAGTLSAKGQMLSSINGISFVMATLKSGGSTSGSTSGASLVSATAIGKAKISSNITANAATQVVLVLQYVGVNSIEIEASADTPGTWTAAVIKLTNIGNSSMTWSMSTDETWLTTSITSGVLPNFLDTVDVPVIVNMPFSVIPYPQALAGHVTITSNAPTFPVVIEIDVTPTLRIDVAGNEPGGWQSPVRFGVSSSEQW